jgi:halogenation protein CepH
MECETFDLTIVGGGPAGSTLGALVARQGHKVLLLEKERFPRYQIGESLLPSTIQGICGILGVTKELEEANFVKKFGGVHRWGKQQEPWSFEFGQSDAFQRFSAFAYQVERMKFDQILLNNARQSGVDVREEHAAVEPLLENGRITGVHYTDQNGRAGCAKALFVADASGNTSRISRFIGERIYSRFFRNLALFCYFENGKRLPPPLTGNIITAAFDGGWFWYIPLSEKLTSVGAVISSHQAEEIRTEGYEAAMNRMLGRCPLIADFLSSASRVTTGLYGQLRIRRDWSYSCSKYFIPGAFLIGDSACFIDPLLSTGVHLATFSALLAARSVNSVLGKRLEEEVCMHEFEFRYRQEFERLYQFLVSFYDLQKHQQSYFWNARCILSAQENEEGAFARLVGGAATWGNTEDFVQYLENMNGQSQARRVAAAS